MTLPLHSPLGGSSASRFMKCPGSVQMAYGVEDPESDHAALGTAAHKLGEICLTQNKEAWSMIGQEMHRKIIVDSDMANAVQVYLDVIRRKHPDRNQGNCWIEKQFVCPSIHPLFYGRADFVYWDEEALTLHIYDYKHGAGVVIEIRNNVQCMHYACGTLEQLQLWYKAKYVVLHVIQPRAFHFDGPVREWSISVEDLVAWLEDELIPAMDKAMVSQDTKSGEHCQFCPARYRACPSLMADMKEYGDMLDKLKEDGAARELTNQEASRFFQLRAIAKIVDKAVMETIFARLNSGHKVEGCKLSPARSNRVWKPSAEEALKKQFGAKAYSEPELLSPAQIDALPGGKSYTTRYAFKPNTGLTVTADSDPRPTVNKPVSSLFKDTTKKEVK